MFCNIYGAQDYLALLWPTNNLPNSGTKTQQFCQDLILEGFSFLWQIFLPNGIVLYLSWNLLSKSCDSHLNKQLFRAATLGFGAPPAALTSLCAVETFWASESESGLVQHHQKS